ncbi:MAG: hypothetical protein DMF80_19585 [Acidobacteria bacterium]|nr:MAG: hypothetical protein DMF80_19585 [Acidobacteriota bacterium]
MRASDSRVSGLRSISILWLSRYTSPLSRCWASSRKASSSLKRPSSERKASSRTSISAATITIDLWESASSKA